MTVSDLRVDEKVWLRPRTLGAGRECMLQLPATVVNGRPVNGYVTVRLFDGRDIQVQVDNVSRTAPRPTRPRKPKATPRPTVKDAEEVPLW